MDRGSLAVGAVSSRDRVWLRTLQFCTDNLPPPRRLWANRVNFSSSYSRHIRPSTTTPSSISPDILLGRLRGPVGQQQKRQTQQTSVHNCAWKHPLHSYAYLVQRPFGHFDIPRSKTQDDCSFCLSKHCVDRSQKPAHSHRWHLLCQCLILSCTQVSAGTGTASCLAHLSAALRCQSAIRRPCVRLLVAHQAEYQRRGQIAQI